MAIELVFNSVSVKRKLHALYSIFKKAIATIAFEFISLTNPQYSDACILYMTDDRHEN